MSVIACLRQLYLRCLKLQVFTGGVPMNASHLAVFTTVLAVCVCVSPMWAQAPQSEPALPVVRSADVPLYPDLARMARIEGTARMHVWTDGSSIVKVEGSGAHKMLTTAAEENLRTWRFYTHKPMSFTVTFVYSIDPIEVFGFVNPSVVLQLPTRVEIRTKAHPLETTETD